MARKDRPEHGAIIGHLCHIGVGSGGFVLRRGVARLVIDHQHPVVLDHQAVYLARDHMFSQHRRERHFCLAVGAKQGLGDGFAQDAHDFSGNFRLCLFIQPMHRAGEEAPGCFGARIRRRLGKRAPGGWRDGGGARGRTRARRARLRWRCFTKIGRQCVDFAPIRRRFHRLFGRRRLRAGEAQAGPRPAVALGEFKVYFLHAHQLGQSVADHMVPTTVGRRLRTLPAAYVEPVLGTGHGDIEQASIFIHIAPTGMIAKHAGHALLARAPTGPERQSAGVSVFGPQDRSLIARQRQGIGQKHDRCLQALGAVHRHHPNLVAPLFGIALELGLRGAQPVEKSL